MVNPGENTVLVSGDVGLSDVTAKQGDDTVVHDALTGRGSSVPKVGQDVVMLTDSLAQSGGGVPSNIELRPLTASDYLLYKGQTTTMTLPVVNSADVPDDFTVPWKENQTEFAEQTLTINPRSTKEYEQTRTKTATGEFTYQASRSNTITVSWLNVDPGAFEANPNVLNPGNTATLSIDVANPNSDDVDVQVEFFNGQDTLLDTQTKTIPGGSGSETYSLDQTINFRAEVDYYVSLTELGTGVSGTSRTQTVTWTNADLLADWGEGLQEITATSVQSFSDFYGLSGVEATHGNFREFGTAVQVLDDGSSIGVSVTHHDANGPQTSGLPFTADTSFTFKDGSYGGIVVKDDPPDQTTTDTYSPSGWHHEFNGQHTDGGVFVLPSGADVVVSVSGDNTDGITFWNTGEQSGYSVRIVNNQ